MRIHELNCGTLNVPGGAAVFGASHFVCRCLLIELPDRLVAVDTGIGRGDIDSPELRLGKDWIEQVGPALDPAETLFARVSALGLDPRDVSDIVLTHHHRDHAGGLSDFPAARVHATSACRSAVVRGEGHTMYAQWAHGVRWAPAPTPASAWRGRDSWTLDGLPASIRLVALSGHSPGHAGVLIEDAGGGDDAMGWQSAGGPENPAGREYARGQENPAGREGTANGESAGGRELLHVGDAIYHHAQLGCAAPPAVEAFAAAVQHDATARLATERLLADLAGEGTVRLLTSHDPAPVQRPEPTRTARRTDTARRTETGHGG
ncbi:MBL fold metallo-hydrolase [Streptomyces sp. HSW2009]|uniref:MBL fold metallo-hydrolase n=1 Tax=Streptomyces sp. HSW2009 TaxID=3142890 RepID=UPI0032ED6BE1